MPYTYEQFLQMRNQQKHEIWLNGFAENLQGILDGLDLPTSTMESGAKASLKEKLPGYINAIRALTAAEVTKESYDNAMTALADFPEYLISTHNQESFFSRIFNGGRQRVIFYGPDDLGEPLAALDMLTNLGLRNVPAIGRVYNNVARLFAPLEAPQQDQANPLPEQGNIINENVNEININAGNEGNPGDNNEINAQNGNGVNANENPNGFININELDNQEENQPNPQFQMPPAPLSAPGLVEPANRLKTHFLETFKRLPANVNANNTTLTGELRLKLPLFANAIATLGTVGLQDEQYQSARTTLLDLKPLLLRMGGTGNLGWTNLRRFCGSINGGCPTEGSLKADLQALNGSLQLGLETLDQDIEQIGKLRGRKVDELRRVSLPIRQDALQEAPPENVADRTALQHLNALYRILFAYDTNYSYPDRRFNKLRDFLKNVLESVAGDGDAAMANKILQNGSMARALREADQLLRDEDQTINAQDMDKPLARDLLRRAAAAMHIHPDDLVSEELYNEVLNAERSYLENRQAQLQQQQQQQQVLAEQQRIETERFGTELGTQQLSYHRAMRNAILRITDAGFHNRSPEAKLNAVIGLFALIRYKTEARVTDSQVVDRAAVLRAADELAQLPQFADLVSQNSEDLIEALQDYGEDGALRFLRTKQLEQMDDLSEKIPESLLPEAIDLTHNRIEQAKIPEFRNLPMERKLHTLAQILAAREVVGSTRNKAGTLKRNLNKKFFARTRELEQCKTFRKFLERNEERIIGALQGRTHGGAMEDLFKTFVRQQAYLPDDIPARFMPTAQVRIEDLQNLIKSDRFRDCSPEAQRSTYVELMATRLAVNSVRKQKSSLNFVLDGEALAKAREHILADRDMRQALGDPDMFRAAKDGHGGRMEEIAARRNLTDPLKESLDSRYQPTAKEWIAFQMEKLRNSNPPLEEPARKAIAARIFVTLQSYGNDLDKRIGQNGPSAGELNQKSAALAQDGTYLALCEQGGVPTQEALRGTRNPLRLLKNNFQARLTGSNEKPLDGSFTSLSPARNVRRNPQPAAPVNADELFQRNKALLAGHMAENQQDQASAAWRDLNPRTVKRALAEIAVCTVQNPNEPLSPEALRQKSTELMESKDWQTMFAGKSIQELQELVVNAENRNQAFQRISEAVQAAQPQPAPQVPQAAPVEGLHQNGPVVNGPEQGNHM